MTSAESLTTCAEVRAPFPPEPSAGLSLYFPMLWLPGPLCLAQSGSVEGYLVHSVQSLSSRLRCSTHRWSRVDRAGQGGAAHQPGLLDVREPKGTL